jgi:outer membrane biogenesis lipoprotein LolB
MRRLAVIIATVATAVLAAACGGSSSASGDTRACQMVKTELTGAQKYAAAQAAAVSPDLKKQISNLAYGQSIQGDPYPLGATGLALAESAVTDIGAICTGDGVTGIGEA